MTEQLVDLKGNIMAYRNIEINGKTFSYSVGKSHVHVKGDGIKSFTVHKDDIGERQWQDCGCGDGRVCPDGDYHIAVTPGSVRSYLVGKYRNVLT